jgi:hypothetical protein
MKKIIASLAAVAALSAACINANAATDAGNTTTLGGTVAKLCVMPSATPQNINIVTAGAINPADSTVEAASLLNVNYPNTMCNYKAWLGVKTKNGGLTKGNVLANTLPSPPAGFLNRVDYTAVANWTGTFITPALVTNGTPAAKTEIQDSDTSQNATLTVTINTANGSTPVEEGIYGDVLTVGIGAQI